MLVTCCNITEITQLSINCLATELRWVSLGHQSEGDVVLFSPSNPKMQIQMYIFGLCTWTHIEKNIFLIFLIQTFTTGGCSNVAIEDPPWIDDSSLHISRTCSIQRVITRGYHHQISHKIYCLVVWNMFFSRNWECHHPKWLSLTPSLFRGVGQPPTSHNWPLWTIMNHD